MSQHHAANPKAQPAGHHRARAIRRSPERADFWRRLLTYRRQSRPLVLEAIAAHAGDADIYILPTPPMVRRFLAQTACGMPEPP